MCKDSFCFRVSADNQSIIRYYPLCGGENCRRKRHGSKKYRTGDGHRTGAVSGETEKQEEPSVEKQSVDCYAYQTLPEEVRTVYDEVYDAILYEKEDVALSTLDNEVLHQAYVSVMADHGGLFWVSGYTYTQYTRGKSWWISILHQSLP